MLKVSGLNVFYGAIHAIHGVSLEVREGEIVSLIGANGAGKTTILHTITGLKKASSGQILLQDADLLATEPHKIVTMGMAHVPEGRRIFASMTVEENLEMGAFFRKDKGAAQSDMEDVFQRFPRLRERRRQLAGTLSVLLVEQNAKMALSIANRAYVLETGNVVMEGGAREMLGNDQVRKAYLGA